MQTLSEMEFEEVSGRDGNLGLITLTRQQALNALNQQMIIALRQQLEEWETANHIKAVVIRAAEGRAFCAGGDIRSLYDRKLNHDPTLPEFFRDEYTLTRRIHDYSKPYIALMDGITMGGGAGISLHGSHRVASDRLLFAMPETAIGFYPDVGTTYILPRLPHKMGYYLGLSSAQLSLADCMAIGLLDHAVKSEQFPDLIYALADTSFKEEEQKTITNLINDFSVPVNDSSLFQHHKIIEHCFNQKTVEGIIKALNEQTDPWCKDVVRELKTKCPTSLKVTLRALQTAEQLEFDEAIQMEFRITHRFLQGTNFFEGIRAAVVDKDKTPHWKPATLKEVTSASVQPYFAPLDISL
ncbi:MAG TPA: enoyl-CoA hydratase/isomerase family protein [Gammaproteobacteria bacterium]|nr:enoyl-CoA hydratase/isomerase family protein [Gammaproteobacteria bacterium]